MSEKEIEFYQRLEKQLSENYQWPSDYLYKFFIPTLQEESLLAIEHSFDNLGAVITTKLSSNKKYTSISILVNMETAASVISKYQELSKIENIISL
jgi:putative lipoic acid-binding regulatory protein